MKKHDDIEKRPPVTVHAIHKQLLAVAAAEIAKLPEHLEQLTPAERVRFILAVLPYTAPKVDKVQTDFAQLGDGWPSLSLP